jgi:hypothetical protein
VPEGVIDLLHPVEVDEHDGEDWVLGVAAGRGQPIEETRPVRQPAERVADGLVGHEIGESLVEPCRRHPRELLAGSAYQHVVVAAHPIAAADLLAHVDDGGGLIHDHRRGVGHAPCRRLLPQRPPVAEWTRHQLREPVTDDQTDAAVEVQHGNARQRRISTETQVKLAAAHAGVDDSDRPRKWPDHLGQPHGCDLWHAVYHQQAATLHKPKSCR